MADTPRKTIVVNLIGGPSSGKTTLAAYLFYKLKIRGKLVEFVPEVAKGFVWRGQFDVLNNQHYVSTEQYNMLMSLDGKVDIIVTDGSLLHGLYYNRINVDNTSNVDKTEQMILANFAKFRNINIFVERGDYPYETSGRYQMEGEARQIDAVLKHLLDKKKIEYTSISATDRKRMLIHVVDQIES
jgi:tRNA uridine 5-carbamoylmethylation protein Kti12